MPKRTRGDYALLWANGMTFGQVYDLMKADIQVETLEWAQAQRAAEDDLPIPYVVVEEALDV